MLSVIKLLWGSTAGKIGLALTIGLFVAGLGISYSMGSSNGHTSGFTDGQKSRDLEVADLNLKVTTLTAEINTKREAESTKIDKVEALASDAAVATQKDLAQERRERDAIIARYEKQTSPETKESCGLSIETVRAINLLIDSANDETTPTPDSPDGVADSGDTDRTVPYFATTIQEGVAS